MATTQVSLDALKAANRKFPDKMFNIEGGKIGTRLRRDIPSDPVEKAKVLSYAQNMGDQLGIPTALEVFGPENGYVFKPMYHKGKSENAKSGTAPMAVKILDGNRILRLTQGGLTQVVGVAFLKGGHLTSYAYPKAEKGAKKPVTDIGKDGAYLLLDFPEEYNGKMAPLLNEAYNEIAIAQGRTIEKKKEGTVIPIPLERYVTVGGERTKQEDRGVIMETVMQVNDLMSEEYARCPDELTHMTAVTPQQLRNGEKPVPIEKKEQHDKYAFDTRSFQSTDGAYASVKADVNFYQFQARVDPKNPDGPTHIAPETILHDLNPGALFVIAICFGVAAVSTHCPAVKIHLNSPIIIMRNGPPGPWKAQSSLDMAEVTDTIEFKPRKLMGYETKDEAPSAAPKREAEAHEDAPPAKRHASEEPVKAADDIF